MMHPIVFGYIVITLICYIIVMSLILLDKNILRRNSGFNLIIGGIAVSVLWPITVISLFAINIKALLDPQ